GKVSGFLHEHVNQGDTVDLFPPTGAFTLAEGNRPIVLISGGVGITPTLAMLDQALETGREIRFIHAARHGGVHAFREHIDGLAKRHPQLKRHYIYAEERAGQPQADAIGMLGNKELGEWLPQSRDVDAYFLGPLPFMQSVKRSLRELGVPEAQT